MCDCLYRVAAAKLEQGNFLYRAGLPQAAGETGVVHDTSAANVNAVMAIAVALRGEVSAKGRFRSQGVHFDLWVAAL